MQKIRWINASPSGHDYSGIFNGNDFGLIRYSLAAENDSKKWGEDSSQVVGIAMKFLRDGVHSGNIHAMHGFEGTSTPNFFENQFSNHIKVEKAGWEL